MPGIKLTIQAKIKTITVSSPNNAELGLNSLYFFCSAQAYHLCLTIKKENGVRWRSSFRMTAPDLLTFYRFAHTVYAAPSLQRQLFRKATGAVIRLEVRILLSPQLRDIVPYPFKGVDGACLFPFASRSNRLTGTENDTMRRLFSRQIIGESDCHRNRRLHQLREQDLSNRTHQDFAFQREEHQGKDRLRRMEEAHRRDRLPDSVQRQQVLQEWDQDCARSERQLCLSGHHRTEQGKMYYFRIRSSMKISGKTVYSP